MAKEKILEHPFLLIVNGPSCGGKSSVSDVLWEKYGGIFKGKSDALKWLISDYDPPTHRDAVHQITFETIHAALSHGLSVIKEGLRGTQPKEYTKLAKKAGVRLFVANIEAPWEILVSRFEQRIEAKKQGAKISNTDPKRFKELYDMYVEAKIDSPLLFDSSKQTPEQIADAIVTYMRKSDK